MSGPYGGPNQFTDARHALYAGWVLGLMMREGLIVMPVIDRGNYTPEVQIIWGKNSARVRIEYPPDEWKMGEE